MATFYTSSVKDPSAPPVDPKDAAEVGGGVNHVVGTVEVPTGLTNNDKYVLAQLPSNAVLLPGSKLYCDALTSGVLDLGDANDPNGLVAGQSVASATSFDANAAVDKAKYAKRLWEVLGYTSDPGGMLDIEATLTTVPTAAGTLSWVFLYSVA